MCALPCWYRCALFPTCTLLAVLVYPLRAFLDRPVLTFFVCQFVLGSWVYLYLTPGYICTTGGGEAAARGRAPLPAGSSLFRCFSVAFLFPFFSPSFPCFRPAVFSLLVFLSSVAVSVSFSLNPVRGTLIFSRIARIRPRSNTSMHTSFLGRAHRKND